MSPRGTDPLADFSFTEQSLVDLLGELRARASSHPENPGLVACWPAVTEHRMAGACTELVRLGYPVKQVSVGGWDWVKTRDGWAIAA